LLRPDSRLPAHLVAPNSFANPYCVNGSAASRDACLTLAAANITPTNSGQPSAWSAVAGLCARKHSLPIATMDEGEDRRIRAAGPVNIELFYLSRSVGRALRGADTGTRCVAVAVKALAHMSDEGFVIHLVVRRIEFELVIIHEHQRPLVVLRRSH